jgi:hypothetical protein
MLTAKERDAVIDDGATLAGDVLWTDDERDRWRRFLEVAYAYRYCVRCRLWTMRKETDPCCFLPRMGEPL